MDKNVKWISHFKSFGNGLGCSYGYQVSDDADELEVKPHTGDMMTLTNNFKELMMDLKTGGSIMSFAGIFTINNKLIGFADTKTTSRVDGKMCEDLVRGRIQKIFEGGNFIIATCGNNQLVGRHGEKKAIEDIIKPLLGSDSLDVFFNSLYKKLIYWDIPDQLTFCAGTTYRNNFTETYEIRCVEIRSNHMIIDQHIYSEENCFCTIGDDAFCEHFGKNKKFFCSENVSKLNEEIVRLVDETEKNGYCPVGKDITFIKKDLLDG